MARIFKYDLDNTINDNDKVVGTDGAIDALNATKNFSVEALSQFIIDKAFNGTDTYLPVFDGELSIVNSALKQDAAANPTTLTVGTDVTLAVTTNATVGGTLGVTGATTLSGTLGVTGISTFTGVTNHNGGVSSTTGAFSDTLTASAAAAITANANNAEIKLGNVSAESAQTIRFQGSAGDTIFTGGLNESADREWERFSIGWSVENDGALSGTWISGEIDEANDQDYLYVGSTAIDYLELTVQSTGQIRANNNVELTGAGDGIILKSPNGTRYKLTVTDGGALTISAA